MERALYLRPAAVIGTGLDMAVKAWLVLKGFEPADTGAADHVVYLPYDGDGHFYHRDVSVQMALAIVEAIRDGRHVHGLRVHGTETQTLTEDGVSVVALVEARFAWDDGCHGGHETIAILAPDDQREAEASIRENRSISYHDLGQVWRPDWQSAPRPATWHAAVDTTPISDREVEVLRRIAAEAPDGVIRRVPGPAGTFAWFEMCGLVEACEVDGTPAWRITDKGREKVA